MRSISSDDEEEEIEKAVVFRLGSIEVPILYSNLCKYSNLIPIKYRKDEIKTHFSQDMQLYQQINNIDESNISTFFNFFLDTNIKITITNCVELYKLSNYLQVPLLSKKIRKFIEKNNEDIEIIIQKISTEILKGENDSDDQKEFDFLFENLLSSRIDECFHSILFKKLPISIIYRILEKSAKNQNINDSLFDFIKQSIEEFYVLLSLIDIQSLSDDKLEDLYNFFLEDESKEKYLQYLPIKMEYIKKLKEQKDEIKKFQHILNEKNTVIQKLMSQLNIEKGENQNLKSQMSEIQMENQNIKSKMSEMQIQNQNLKSQMSDIQMENQKIKSQFNKIQSENHISKKFNEINSENQNLMSQFNDVQSENQILKSQFYEIKKENQYLKIQLSKMQSEKQIYKSQFSEIQNENQHLRLQLSKIQSENEINNSKFSGMQDENPIIKSQFNQLHNESPNIMPQFNQLQNESPNIMPQLIEVQSEDQHQKLQFEGMQNDSQTIQSQFDPTQNSNYNLNCHFNESQDKTQQNLYQHQYKIDNIHMLNQSPQNQQNSNVPL